MWRETKLLHISKEIKSYKPPQQRKQDMDDQCRRVLERFLEDMKKKECWLVKESRRNYCLEKYGWTYSRSSSEISSKLWTLKMQVNRGHQWQADLKTMALIVGQRKLVKSLHWMTKHEGRINQFPDVRTQSYITFLRKLPWTYFNKVTKSKHKNRMTWDPSIKSHLRKAMKGRSLKTKSLKQVRGLQEWTILGKYGSKLAGSSEKLKDIIKAINSILKRNHCCS